jgi:hypothetical protein
MTHEQLADGIRGLYIQNRSQVSPCFNALFECVMEITPRNTKPAFYSMVIRKDDGIIVVKEYPYSKWHSLAIGTSHYYYKQLVADTLKFCYMNNASFLERKYILSLFAGLIVSKDYIDNN